MKRGRLAAWSGSRMARRRLAAARRWRSLERVLRSGAPPNGGIEGGVRAPALSLRCFDALGRFSRHWSSGILAAVAGARRKVLDTREGFVEPELAALAARQHGVVSRRQLMAMGLRSAAIGRRIDAGRLHRVHLGVYAVGHPLLSRHGRWMAGVLACGTGAALGYDSAAVLWDLVRSDAGT